jgi:hypothetical protein
MNFTLLKMSFYFGSHIVMAVTISGPPGNLPINTETPFVYVGSQLFLGNS